MHYPFNHKEQGPPMVLQNKMDVKHQPCLVLATLFALGISLCGCSSSFVVGSNDKPDTEYSYGEINEAVKGRDVRIELKGRGGISAKEFKISGDSVSWVDQRTNETSTSSIREIDKIVMESSSIGAWEGLGIGLFGGAGLGALVGRGSVTSSEDWEKSLGTGVGLIVGGGTGIVVGLITGSVIGHSYNYEFRVPEQRDSLQKGR